MAIVQLLFLMLAVSVVQSGRTERISDRTEQLQASSLNSTYVIVDDEEEDAPKSELVPRDSSQLPQPPAKNEVSCRGLRSKRYVSDGFCRTIRPISEILCTGYCLPERNLPWYPEFLQDWGHANVLEYRCVDGVVKQQRTKLMCDNGKTRVYTVKVVKSCACQRQTRRHDNHDQQTPASSVSPSLERSTRRRHGRKKHKSERSMQSNA
jgi:hypothetical protein